MLNIHIENNVNSNYSLRGHKKKKKKIINVIYQRESEKRDIVTQLFVHVGVYKQIR